MTFSVDSAAKNTLINSPFPLIILETNGNVIWRSSTFNKEFANVGINAYIDELAKDDKNKIIVLDAPTLFESGCDKFCDVIVSVTASMGSRLKRIQARDKIDVHSAMERISAQPDDEFYITKSNRVIKNDGSSEALTLEINNTILWLRKQANEKNEIF